MEKSCACVTLKIPNWRISNVNELRLFEVTQAVLFSFVIEYRKLCLFKFFFL